MTNIPDWRIVHRKRIIELLSKMEKGVVVERLFNITGLGSQSEMFEALASYLVTKDENNGYVLTRAGREYATQLRIDEHMSNHCCCCGGHCGGH